MRKMIRYILLFPIFVLIVALAIANSDPVSFSLSLNPFNPSQPALTLSDIPLFVPLFCTLLLGILLGGIVSWFKQGKLRRQLRKSQNEVNRLQQAAK